MAVHDIYNDPAPQNTLRPLRTPKVSTMRTALFGFSATSYSQARLDDMTRNDMFMACKQHGLTAVNPV